MISVANEFRVLKHGLERFRQARVDQVTRSLGGSRVRHESMDQT